MSFNNDDLAKLAHLARLDTPENLDLNPIVELFATLEKVDTSNIEPMANALEIHNTKMRDDTVSEPNQRDALQKIARSDATAAGFYLVPPVIE
ncbi:MAG: Asp-tRNA(Asn)/Glu-tRNA(Gln) amidotransferase GatCAB subunit C [Legionellales bacterium]|nr:MAG: Asp-tRNA(Asn)/Glu-tRNA(Gln) amidotransferase GatCAB subunit C [Legionellales bacterium]